MQMIVTKYVQIGEEVWVELSTQSTTGHTKKKVKYSNEVKVKMKGIYNYCNNWLSLRIC